MFFWMFHCKEVSRRVSESMDRRLPLYQRAMIRMHLAMCRYCLRFYRQLQWLREIARDPGLQEAGMDETVFLSPEAGERLKASLRSQGLPS